MCYGRYQTRDVRKQPYQTRRREKGKEAIGKDSAQTKNLSCLP